jgi:hypothetical protein
MKRQITIVLALLFILLTLFAYYRNKESKELKFNEPVNGLVPDEKTAIKIAESISIPIFGQNINDYKPFHAELVNDSIWHIYGLPKNPWSSIQLGGTPEFNIRKKDGTILSVKISR